VPRRKPADAVARLRARDWVDGSLAGLVAIAALVVGSAVGNVHSAHVNPRIIPWVSAAVLLLTGIFAATRLSVALSRLVRKRSEPGPGGSVRFLAAAVGYLLVLFAVLEVLGVSPGSLLVGAGLAGIVLGIAAQQSLGNVFAGLVLLLARPFEVGDRIRVRSGALGGIFDASVREMSLTYVTLRTDDGEIKIPNSAMLAAGVGQLPLSSVGVDASTPPVAGLSATGPSATAPNPVPPPVAQGGAPSGGQPGS
jgi:small-conductance mechanosensitive channel